MPPSVTQQDLNRRMDELEAAVPDGYSPLFMTVQPDGSILFDFTGHVHAQGLDLDWNSSANLAWRDANGVARAAVQTFTLPENIVEMVEDNSIGSVRELAGDTSGRWAELAVRGFSGNDQKTGVFARANNGGYYADILDINYAGLLLKILDSAGGSDLLHAAAPWHYIGAGGEPAFQNSWVNSGAPYPDLRFRKLGSKYTHIYGTIKNGTNGTTVFTLPSSTYWPRDNLWTIGHGWTGAINTAARASISSSGVVAMTMDSAPTAEAHINVIYPTDL